MLAVLDGMPNLHMLQLNIVGAFSAQLLPQMLQHCRQQESLNLFALLDSSLFAELPLHKTVDLSGSDFRDVLGETLCAGKLACEFVLCKERIPNFHMSHGTWQAALY